MIKSIIESIRNAYQKKVVLPFDKVFKYRDMNHLKKDLELEQYPDEIVIQALEKALDEWFDKQVSPHTLEDGEKFTAPDYVAVFPKKVVLDDWIEYVKNGRKKVETTEATDEDIEETLKKLEDISISEVDTLDGMVYIELN